MLLIQCASLCVCLLLDVVALEIYKSRIKKYLSATETLSIKVFSHRAKAEIFFDACRLHGLVLIFFALFFDLCLSRSYFAWCDL